MKIYTIYLDGIDKTGKDSILPYIGPLCNYSYICNIRGVISQIAYADLYKRNLEYDLSQQKYCLNVLLTVDKEDWDIRCNVSGEPSISYEDNCAAFDKAYKLLEDAHCPVMRINTSKYSMYEIAKQIVEELNHLQNETKMEG